MCIVAEPVTALDRSCVGLEDWLENAWGSAREIMSGHAEGRAGSLLIVVYAM